MEEVLDFIIGLKNKHVFIQEVNGQIRMSGNLSVLSADDKEKIKNLKAPLLLFLRNSKKESKRSFNRINPVQHADYYPLSSSQRRLWILSQFEKANIAYNMPGVYVFEGRLDRTALENSFTFLMERHEILRTVFKVDEQGEVWQYILQAEDTGFKVTYRDVRYSVNSEEKIKEILQSEFIRPFSLASGPLLRASLYQVNDNKWIFTYTMHHIISDGWSMEILIRELLLLYNAHIQRLENPLASLRIQYKDYAAWQQEQLSGEALKEDQNYWLNQFEGDLPVLDLLGDKVRPSLKTYNGASITKIINPKLTQDIKALSQQEESTLFMGLLAIVNILLYRYSHQCDIIIGCPIAGREHIDLEDQIGFYVNILALRSRFKMENSFKELLNNIKQVTLGAYAHRLYPFDDVIDLLKLGRDLSRNPLFDVMVILQNTVVNSNSRTMEFLDIQVSSFEITRNPTSKVDLTFDFVENGDEINVTIVYNSDLFGFSYINKLGDEFIDICKLVVEDCNLKLQSIKSVFKNDEENKEHELFLNQAFEPFENEF